MNQYISGLVHRIRQTYEIITTDFTTLNECEAWEWYKQTAHHEAKERLLELNTELVTLACARHDCVDSTLEEMVACGRLTLDNCIEDYAFGNDADGLLFERYASERIMHVVTSYARGGHSPLLKASLLAGSKAERLCMVLHYHEGLDDSAIGRVMDLSENEVQAIRKRALMRAHKFREINPDKYLVVS